MGLLDELEQEAQKRKASLGDSERSKQERETQYKSVLEPGMNALHDYLTKLTQNLGYLKPKTGIQHVIPGYGTVIAYVEHDYELRANPSPSSKEITLSFHAMVSSDECPTVEVQTPAKVRTMNGFFQKYRLAGLHEFKKDDHGEIVQATFKARGKIPLHVSIYADADSGQIKVSFTNFDALGVASKTFQPLQFNEQLFDDIGRFIARESSSLFRENLPDDFRKQLQSKIQQENMRRKWETKIVEQNEPKAGPKSGKFPAQPPAEPANGQKPGSLLDRMKNLFKKD